MEQEGSAEKLPVLGDFSKLTDAFHNSLSKWFGAAPIKRLAFGAVLLQPVDSHEEGYALLDKYLPAVELDPNASDFAFQINRARSSGVVDTMRVNRLSKWSVMKFQGVQLQFEANAQESVNAVTGITTKPAYADRLELDISTDAGRTDAFDQAVLKGVFGELVGMALEIASRGDVP
jgi:hypothetical protein